MAKELIAFLNFAFRQNLVNVKSVSGETMTEVPRFVINWREYQAVLASMGVKHEASERPLFRRYLSNHSTEDLYNDLVAFQEELRQTLRGIIEAGKIPAAVWKRVFKDTDGLPMFIEPEGDGDLTPSADLPCRYDFSADTYRLFMLAMVRGLILNRRLFSLTVDGSGKFDLPEPQAPAAGAGPDIAAAPPAADSRAALRAAVARDLPAALAGAVAEKLPAALAESAAEKLPAILDALAGAQLPEALAQAVETALPGELAKAVEAALPGELAKAVEAALPGELAKAVEAALPEALAKEERVEEITPPPPDGPPAAPAAQQAPEEAPAGSFSIAGPSSGPSFSLSVPSLRLIGLDSSISVPFPRRAAVTAEERAIFSDQPEESEDEEILPRELAAAEEFMFLEETPEAPEDTAPEPDSFSMADLDALPVRDEETPDFSPKAYADTFQEAAEEGFFFDAPGPALEQDEEAAFEVPSDGYGYMFRAAQAPMAGVEDSPDAADDPEDEFIEPEDEDIEDIEPTEDPVAEEEEPLVLCERLEPEEAGTEGPATRADAETEEEGGEGWLPFLKVPSKKKTGKVPLEQRLATLEQRRKRRSESDDQDRFDF